MTKFDPTKPVQTRDGREAEICWTDGGGEFPIGGWFRAHSGNKESANWANNGLSLSDGILRHFDLINVPEKPVTIERWVNVYPNGAVGTLNHLTAERAFRDGGSNCQQVLLTGTGTPGEGLDDD